MLIRSSFKKSLIVEQFQGNCLKCVIFGVMCDEIPCQVNYLINEASDVGKGANRTISFVDHYFEHYRLGETSVHLHTDNCLGQKKNNFFLMVLGLEDNTSTLSFSQIFFSYSWTHKV